jgi:hypothetical protein
MGGSVFPQMKPGQLDPGRRPAGEKASYPCTHRHCLTQTQGGKAGLQAHLAVVHGEWPR